MNIDSNFYYSMYNLRLENRYDIFKDTRYSRSGAGPFGVFLFPAESGQGFCRSAPRFGSGRRYDRLVPGGSGLLERL